MNAPDEFFAYLCTVRARNTAIAYSSAALKFDKFSRYREVDLASPPPGLFEDFVSFLLRRGASPATIHLTVTGVRGYLKWRRTRGEEIPKFEPPKIPSIRHRSPDALSEDDRASYMKLASTLSEPSRTVLLLLPLCGLRCSEMVDMQLENVEHVEREQGKSRYNFKVVNGKGEKDREVPLLLEASPILNSYILGWRGEEGESPWLFPSTMRGRDHVAPATIQKTMRRIRGKLRLPRLTPHTLRRTFATSLDRAGVGPFRIAQIMGHESVQTTYRHYIGRSRDDVCDALDSADV